MNDKSMSASAITSQKNAESEDVQVKESPIEVVVRNYLYAILGIGRTAKIALPHFSKWRNAELDKVYEKVKNFVPVSKTEKEDATLTFANARELAEFMDNWREFKELLNHDPSAVLAKSLFTHLFAEFDSYLGELLKIIYLKDDKLIKGIVREISLSDLMEFQDLSDVKVAMVDKEIETFRRDSYVEQFSALERKFGLSLRKFNEWPLFVELSQRRNLLIHNGGLVSEQYLAVCKRENYLFDTKPGIGEALTVSSAYFVAGSRILSKVGVMLAYTLWSKIFPQEANEFHTSLNGTLYNCLQQQRWKFVAELEDFVLSEPLRKGISEIQLRIRIVNVSIGLKFSGDSQKVNHLLDSLDWTASVRDFKLAIAVLQDRYDEAVDIMRGIGRSGEILRQSSYHSWPLFTEFRKQPEFHRAYVEIYGELFSETVETSNGSVHAQATAPVKSEIGIEKQPISDVEPREVVSKKKPKSRSASGSKKKDTGAA
jgi:hypothetical protein